MRENSHSASRTASAFSRTVRQDGYAHVSHIARMAGWYLKEWRKDRGYTQERLAEMVGTSSGHLSDLENGRRRYNQEVLEALAIALRCEPADILRRKPGDAAAISTEGLDPGQVRVIESMVEQLRKSG